MKAILISLLLMFSFIGNGFSQVYNGTVRDVWKNYNRDSYVMEKLNKCVEGVHDDFVRKDLIMYFSPLYTQIKKNTITELFKNMSVYSTDSVLFNVLGTDVYLIGKITNDTIINYVYHVDRRLDRFPYHSNSYLIFRYRNNGYGKAKFIASPHYSDAYLRKKLMKCVDNVIMEKREASDIWFDSKEIEREAYLRFQREFRGDTYFTVDTERIGWVNGDEAFRYADKGKLTDMIKCYVSENYPVKDECGHINNGIDDIMWH